MALTQRPPSTESGYSNPPLCDRHWLRDCLCEYKGFRPRLGDDVVYCNPRTGRERTALVVGVPESDQDRRALSPIVRIRSLSRRVELVWVKDLRPADSHG